MCSQVKRSSYWSRVRLSPVQWTSFLKGRKEGRDTQTQECHEVTEAELGMMRRQAKGHSCQELPPRYLVTAATRNEYSYCREDLGIFKTTASLSSSMLSTVSLSFPVFWHSRVSRHRQAGTLNTSSGWGTFSTFPVTAGPSVAKVLALQSKNLPSSSFQ